MSPLQTVARHLDPATIANPDLEALAAQTQLPLAQVRDAVADLQAMDPAVRGRLLEKFGGDRGRARAAPGQRGLGSAERGQVGLRARGAPSAAARSAAKKVQRGLAMWFIPDWAATSMVRTLAKLKPADLEAALYQLGPSDAFKLLDQAPKATRQRYDAVIDQIRTQFFGHMIREAQAAGVAAKDDSPRFQGILDRVRAGDSAFPQAKAQQYAYLLVPGLVTEHQAGYFENNLDFLKSQGLTAVESRIDTDAGIGVNGPQIRDEIARLAEETGKSVIVIAHSKGVPDSVFALKGHPVEEQVAAFLPMQGAFGGTPVADTVMQHAGGIIEFGLQKILGAKDKNAVRDIGFESTNRLFNPRTTGALEVPTFGFVSCDEGRQWAGNILEFPSDEMRRKYDVASDGLVPVDSQIVHGQQASYARIDGFHHADSVQILPIEAAQARYRPEHITQAQLTWALEALPG